VGFVAKEGSSLSGPGFLTFLLLTLKRKLRGPDFGSFPIREVHKAKGGKGKGKGKYLEA